jgi:hypothetical protein
MIACMAISPLLIGQTESLFPALCFGAELKSKENQDFIFDLQALTRHQPNLL